MQCIDKGEVPGEEEQCEVSGEEEQWRLKCDVAQ